MECWQLSAECHAIKGASLRGKCPEETTVYVHKMWAMCQCGHSIHQIQQILWDFVSYNSTSIIAHTLRDYLILTALKSKTSLELASCRRSSSINLPVLQTVLSE